MRTYKVCLCAPPNYEVRRRSSANVNHFILQHDNPREIATDRGAEFMANMTTEVCKLLKIKKLNCTLYHHQL